MKMRFAKYASSALAVVAVLLVSTNKFFAGEIEAPYTDKGEIMLLGESVPNHKNKGIGTFNKG